MSAHFLDLVTRALTSVVEDYISNWLGSFAFALSLSWRGRAGFKKAKPSLLHGLEEHEHTLEVDNHNRSNNAQPKSKSINQEHGRLLARIREFKNLQHAKVHHAGHATVLDQPQAVFEIVRRWINQPVVVE